MEPSHFHFYNAPVTNQVNPVPLHTRLVPILAKPEGRSDDELRSVAEALAQHCRYLGQLSPEALHAVAGAAQLYRCSHGEILVKEGHSGHSAKKEPKHVGPRQASVESLEGNLKGY